ncbi:hypothetical protein ACR6C2_33515 [Streptomyces sp. INA 01156]
MVGLCNQVLGEQALTQHKFDWLLGDPGTKAGAPNCRLTRTGPATSWWSSTGNCSTTSPCPTSTSRTSSPSAESTGVSSGPCTTPAVTPRSPPTGCD